ncbi:MAG: hypothetical protein ACOYJU_04675 [Anaerovoracaceae bacterium]
MKRIFAREGTYGDFPEIMEKTKIGVVSLGHGAGGTLFALALSQELGQRNKAAAYLELSGSGEGKPMVYQMLGMEKRFSRRGFMPVFSQIQNNRRINGRENIEAGINWAILHPHESMRELNLSPIQRIKLINNFSGDYIVCDLGCQYLQEIASEMDMIFAIVDPLPSKLIANREMYQKLVGSRQKIIWVLNKDNRGIHRRHFYDYMKIKGHETIPLMQGDILYKAEYNCRLPYEQKEIRETIKPVMEKIVNRHILTKG